MYDVLRHARYMDCVISPLAMDFMHSIVDSLFTVQFRMNDSALEIEDLNGRTWTQYYLTSAEAVN